MPTRTPIRATAQVREEILYYCRESVRCGLNFNTQGNISVRLAADDGSEAILITPSDVRYDAMTPDDMVVVAMDGTVLEGDLLPSTELPVHLAHYRRRPDVQAIVHTESTFVNVLGVLGRRIDPVLLNMVLYAKGPIPVMPFEFSTNADFGRRSAELMGDDVNAVVWANHGLLAVGVSLKLAFKVAVAVEENAEVLHHAGLAGVPSILDYARIDIPAGARLP
ncbi:class II aldolase/adducin family protein [Cellulomonas fengjieae]|uniref:Class II aldolase/adducin family protein n=1 Tax=Cellulomonas fengjieae TaxID=2819978 RepID=A0ABS3SE07_9CELL|nr:class II aldolase/adducin family protein [Cellulomonas fengjieae]MBO3083211.1 class II aldolase/adducin family protein [Cellulomonas fengjieae]QVI65432.1 class II aldolase/adducin family protein [Cellulomonas fengjieae]